MPLWKSTDAAPSKPKLYSADANVFGVDAVEAKNTGKGVSPGWNKVTFGKGYISFNFTAPGTGYTNTNVVTVSSTNPGAVNATANVLTNGAGGVIGFTDVNPGSGFVNNSSTAVSGTGTGAGISGKLSGRAGRVQIETLVALNITGDNNADDTIFAP